MADDTPDLTVEVSKSAKDTQVERNRWHWVSVVGVGTFLIVPVVFWMMTLVSKALEKNATVIENNTAAMTANKMQGEDVESAIRSNTRALNRINQKIGPDPEAEE